MRITRLHLLILLIGLAVAGYGVYVWQMHPKPSAVSSVTPRKASEPESLISKKFLHTNAETAKQKVALAGESYAIFRKTHGDVPAVAAPLRQAKNKLALQKWDEAIQQADAATVAMRNARQSAPEYTVAKGDTLWTIAERHSPVREGGGWYAIWKANQKTVKDFDRIEIGWSLNIPAQPRQYATRYWKPRHLPAVARLPREIELALLAQDRAEAVRELSHDVVLGGHRPRTHHMAVGSPPVTAGNDERNNVTAVESVTTAPLPPSPATLVHLLQPAAPLLPQTQYH
jgi:hypothetical protein